jgi:glutamate transport system substrate-binding protein
VPAARHPAAKLAGFFLLALATACGGSSGAEPSILSGPRIAVGTIADAPGFDYDVPQAGFDIDLVHAIGTALNKKMVSSPIFYKDRPGQLLDDTLQLVIATYSITEDRNDAGIDFAGPYMVSPQGLLVRRGGKRIVTADDLRDKSVCTAEDTTGSQTDIPGAHMDAQQPTTADCVKQLGKGYTDAVFSDWLILDGYMHLHPDKYRVVLPGVFGQLQYLGVGLKKGHHRDCEKLNSILKVFLDKQWATDFRTDFPQAITDYNQETGDARDYQSVFKPTSDEMQRLSCKL